MKKVAIAHGQTYPVRHDLWQLGFRWLKGDKVYVKNVSDELDVQKFKEEMDSFKGVRYFFYDGAPFIGTIVDPVSGLDGKDHSTVDWKTDAISKGLYQVERSTGFAKTGDVIEVKKWVARNLQKEFKTKFFFRNLEIVAVLKETSKAIQVQFKFHSRVANVCHLCGLALGDETSIAIGLGPSCAKKLGISRPNVNNAKEVLAQIQSVVDSFGTMGPAWFAISNIKKLEE